MTTTFRIASTVLVGALVLVSPTAAQVFNCGDTIGPKAKVTLTADVEVCTSATQPALTIIGPVSVDMAGFRVRCDPNDPPAAGLQINGKGAKIFTGGVINCGTGAGVFVAGEGKHKLEDFAVENAPNDGIRITSDKNSLKRISSNDNGGDGVELDGAGNKLEDVVAIANNGDGFESDTDKNQFKRVTAVRSDGHGLNIDDGSQNKVKAGVFINNGVDGVRMKLDGNKVEKSVATMNLGSGFDMRADGNQLKKSRAHGNGMNGVHIVGRNNKVTSNASFGNDTDLADENAACDNNTWRKNTFGTSLADGVAAPACIQ